MRVKRNISSPTLMLDLFCNTSALFTMEKKRYMSHEECLNIQGFKGIKSYPENFEGFYCTIGNAVNVGVVSRIAKNLFNQESAK